MAWRLARSLERMREQVDQSAPHRSKASDGTIGDAAHRARRSDHNPDHRGVVRAIDLTDDPVGGFDAESFSEALRASRDARIKYVIWNRRMFSSYSNTSRSAWQWGAYSGSNQHTHHIHVSIQSDDSADADDSPWTIAGGPASPATPAEPPPDYRDGDYRDRPDDLDKPVLRRDTPNIDGAVGYLQCVLRRKAGAELELSDSGYGTFGPRTEQAVRALQAHHGVTVDGIVGWDGADGRDPGPQATWPIVDRLARAASPDGDDDASGATSTTSTSDDDERAADPPPGAMAAAAAAHRAGFRGDDLATITMIAGRESGWRADGSNPATSDRGMWQINWNNLQRGPYDELRRQLSIERDSDLLDLDTNAAVAFRLFQDSVDAGEPWFPWRGSESGRDGAGPGWDPNGSHLWRTDDFAAEARAAAAAVLGTDAPDAAPSPSTPSTDQGAHRGVYTITGEDADGLIAVVARCVGIVDAPWAVRRAAAEAVARHNGGDLDTTWTPGQQLRIPPTIDGVRCYTVRPGDGLISISRGLGLDGDDAPGLVAAINAWQGTVPHPDDTWYGGLR